MLDINWKEKNSWMHRYGNVHAYYTDALNTYSEHASSRSNDASFTGSQSFEETQERYTKGYARGTAKARELMLELTPFLRTTQGVKRSWRPQRYAGGNFILDNYVRGIPELCNTMSPVVSKKFASLLLNGTASCGVSTNTMEIRGVAALALAQVLEQHGYRVSIKLSYAESSSGHKQYCIIDLKPFNQTIELDRLAFFLADPSAFRRLQFSWMESQPADIRAIMDVPGGYGSPCELPASEIGPNDIYLGCASWHDSHWRNLDTAQAWIKETLKRYGVQVI